MNNPFEVIEERLSSIEELILDLKNQPRQVVPTEQSDQLLTVEEAAEFLSLRVATIYSKSSRGELPSCKAPGTKRLYFSREDLSKIIREGRKKTNREIEAEAESYLKKKRGSNE